MSKRTSGEKSVAAAVGRPGTRRVAMLAYPGVQILDVTGPLEVFARTARWLRDHGRRGDDAYSVEIIGLRRGAFPASSGLRLFADHRFSEVGRGIDTLLIAGGVGTKRYCTHRPLLEWIRRQAGYVRRLGSVCTGSFFLAEAGLLSGHRATTHWGDCPEMARRYPDVVVEPDTIFVRDGSLYTSAGVTAGMDLALALVEEDHGREVALGVARALVMFLRRPGGQAQFSAQLAVQFAEHDALKELQAYILEHPREDLSVERLARRVAMSPRNFSRVFTREVGMAPARFVASARVETARRLLEETSKDLETICSMSGLGTGESMRRAFLRIVGIPPSRYRERFSPHHPSGSQIRAATPGTRRIV
jgi:transcriptional regulator GlxA family with amidase domain